MLKDKNDKHMKEKKDRIAIKRTLSKEIERLRKTGKINTRSIYLMTLYIFL